MKILVFLGNPRTKSFCGALADAYQKGAKKAKIKRINIGDLKFDPILHEGYDKIQKLENDLVKVQNDIKWADHLVFVYPTWWSSMPALMKGLIDRTFLPEFGFRFIENSHKWDKLLKGKSARLIVTMDAPKIFYFIIGSPGFKMMKRGVLGFCGVKPVKITVIDMVKDLSKEKKEGWLGKIEKLGEKESKE